MGVFRTSVIPRSRQEGYVSASDVFDRSKYADVEFNTQLFGGAGVCLTRRLGKANLTLTEGVVYG